MQTPWSSASLESWCKALSTHLKDVGGRLVDCADNSASCVRNVAYYTHHNACRTRIQICHAELVSYLPDLSK